MEERIKFSIIVPVYNTADYLKRCLDSLLNQTYQNFEIICINDGSTDNSLNILEEYNNPKLHIYTKENEGVGIARNFAINYVQGEYILFVDSDDYVDQNLLLECYKRIKDNTDLVIYGCKTFRNKTDRIYNGQYSSKRFSNIFDIDKLFSFHTISMNKVYKKELLLENNIEFTNTKTGEDQIFFIKSILNAKKIEIIKQDLYFYGKSRVNSLTGKKLKNDFSPLENFESIRTYLRNIEINSDLKLKIIGRYLLKTLSWYCKSDPNIKKEYYEKLKKLFDKIQKEEGKGWWDYYNLKENSNYCQIKIEYLKSKFIYFIRERLIYIPASILFAIHSITGKN